MRHNSTKSLGENLDIFAYSENLNTLKMFKIVDNVSIDISPTSITSSEISPNIYKTNITLPNETCIVCIVFNNQPMFLRVGTPIPRYCVYTEVLTNIPYKRYDVDGNIIENSILTSYGNNIYGFIPSDSQYSLIESNNHTETLDVPYGEVIIENPPTNGSSSIFINTGYNMFAFTGNVNSYFDISSGTWIPDENYIAKASDISKAMAYKYGLEWSDKTNPRWIGNYVKYIRTYYENPNQKAFKLYSPSVTPETNENNFDLSQIDENGNTYLRGISILLIQELDIGNDGSSGSIIPFNN